MYSFVVYLFSLFALYSFQYTNLSNPLLKRFDSFWLSFADTMTFGTYNFVSLIVKKILSSLALALSTTAAVKTQFFIYLSFNSTLQLINGIWSDPQKILKIPKVSLMTQRLSCVSRFNFLHLQLYFLII